MLTSGPVFRNCEGRSGRPFAKDPHVLSANARKGCDDILDARADNHGRYWFSHLFITRLLTIKWHRESGVITSGGNLAQGNLRIEERSFLILLVGACGFEPQTPTV